MPPPLLMEPRALPALAAVHSVAGPEPPSQQGVASRSSPGSSANSLSFEIEFGQGEGWLGPAPPHQGWLKASVPHLPWRKLGWGWAGRGWLVKTVEAHCQKVGVYTAPWHKGQAWQL